VVHVASIKVVVEVFTPFLDGILQLIYSLHGKSNSQTVTLDILVSQFK